MKIVLIILGVIITLAGGACATAGGALLAFAGPDGWIESDTARLDSTTYALVSESALVDEEGPSDTIDDLPDIRFRIEAEQTTGDAPLFIGVGRTADVDRYLAGVEHDVVDDVEFDDFRISKVLIPGTTEPQPPADQDVWVQTATGTGKQTLDWKVRSGSYRFVLMNAEPSESIDVQASVALKIPWVLQISITLMVAGIVALLIGIGIIVLAARSATRRTAPPPLPPPPAPVAPPTEPS